jgi:hypothetical protein
VSASVLEPRRATFRAFAETAVPEMTALDEAGWAEVERTVEQALAGRPPRMRRQLGMLLRVIEVLPVPLHGRRFSSLGPAARTRVLDALQHFPVKLIRRGVWGLRTLVLMGYYTRPQTMADVGYRADARGWHAPGVASTPARGEQGVP